MTGPNRNILARNIRHRLADMLGSQWTGALDAAMDEMLLEEIDNFDIIQILPAAEKLEAEEGPVHEPRRTRRQAALPSRRQTPG